MARRAAVRSAIVPVTTTPRPVPAICRRDPGAPPGADYRPCQRKNRVPLLAWWADKIAAPNGKKVPHFDPRSGGKNARVLVLLQDPSRVAQHGSRFISRDN